MTEIEIPVDSLDPFYDLTVELSKKNYIIEIAWNVENEFWTFSIFTADKLPILLNRKIVINYPLFAFTSNPLLPPGQLFAIDTSNTFKDCGYDDLGDRVKLIYQSND